MQATSQTIGSFKQEGLRVPPDKGTEIIQQNVIAVFSLIQEAFNQRSGDFSVNFEPKKAIPPHFCSGPDSTTWVHLHVFDKEKLGTGLIAQVSLQDGEFQIGAIYGEPHPLAFPLFVNLGEKGFEQLEKWAQDKVATLMKDHEAEIAPVLANSLSMQFGVAEARNDWLMFLTMYDKKFGIDANRIPSDLANIIGEDFVFRR